MSKQQQWMRNRPDGPLHKPDISCESNGCWPVAVIDVEDREQVERLADALVNARQGHKFGNAYPREIDQLQAALREFAKPKPPKPDEPQGLGAVVEDADGKRYVRCSEGRERWHCPDDDTGGSDDYYDGIDAVRVLSEGVQP